MIIEQWEQDLIGQEVEGTMGGDVWITGRLVRVIDLFVPYILMTDLGERGFISIRKPTVK